MRVCGTPKVYLAFRPMLAEGVQDFLDDLELKWPTEPLWQGDNSLRLPTQAEQGTELAGRICYMSFGAKAGSKTNAEYLNNLIGLKPGRTSKLILQELEEEAASVPPSNQRLRQLTQELQKVLEAERQPAHGSVLEHANFSFIVVNAGRGFSHEQVRHRAGWSYSQLSTRYCDFERGEAQEGTWDPGFTIPPLARLNPKTAEYFEHAHAAALDHYRKALSLLEFDLGAHGIFAGQLDKLPAKEAARMLRKAARGAARDLLPNGTEAILLMTANVRAIWNTIYLRASEHAEAEIRAVYVQVARLMQKEMPTVFKGLEFFTLWDGSEAVRLPRDKL